MTFDYQLILCIVNEGFAETVMDIAKDNGARGGTILSAKGTANKEAERNFRITISPEKDIVMILVPTALKDGILHALYKGAGLDTPSQGIAFAMPVDNVIGLNKPIPTVDESIVAEEATDTPLAASDADSTAD